MSETRFTPGPWHATQYEAGTAALPSHWLVHTETDASYEATIAELWSGEHDNEHNARLIAAAPELYAALVEVLAAERASKRPPKTTAEAEANFLAIAAAVTKAEAALAKARGES